MRESDEQRCYNELANAIVIQAVDDYRKTDNDNVMARKSIEKFFKSGWFKLLTDTDSTYLIEQLRQEKETDYPITENRITRQMSISL